jgi:hypothetical protein
MTLPSQPSRDSKISGAATGISERPCIRFAPESSPIRNESAWPRVRGAPTSPPFHKFRVVERENSS